MDCTPIFKNTLKASHELNILDVNTINRCSFFLPMKLRLSIPDIITENEKDLALMDKTDPRYDRLLLTPERIKKIASDIRNIAGLPSPVGRITLSITNQLDLQLPG